MGYKIQYGKDKRKNHRKFYLKTGFAAGILLCSVLARICFPGEIAGFLEKILPPAILTGAKTVVCVVEDMVAEESVSDAVTTFCQELFGGE